MGLFFKDFDVRYYEINRHGEVTLVSLINYLQESAIAHSEEVNFGIKRLGENNWGWALINWNIEIDKYPFYMDKIKVKTYVSSFNRFYSYRNFEVLDSSRNVIVKAKSLWIFMDIGKRKPISIPDDIYSAYGIEMEHKKVDNNFLRIKLEDDYEKSKDFYVRRGDIDTNGHVNNVRYAEWILEAIPLKVYENFILKKVEITYKKESKYGMLIESRCKTIELNEDNGEFISYIVDKENNELLSAAKTYWIKR